MGKMSHSAYLIYLSCTKSKHNWYTVSSLRVSTLPACRHQGILILTQAAPPKGPMRKTQAHTSFN